MKRIVAAVAVLMLLAGCVRVHQCDPTQSDVALSQLNRSLSTHDVRVVMRDGTRIKGEQMRVGRDSSYISVPPPPSNQPPPEELPIMTVRTADVASIKVKRPGLGGLRGAGTGFLLGGATSVALWAASDSSDGFAALGAIAFTLGSSLVGLVFGAMVGVNDVYELSAVSADTTDR